MSSTTLRRVAAALVVTALLALPARPALAAHAASAAVRAQGPTATVSGFFESSWIWVAELLGLPAPAGTAPGSLSTPAAGQQGRHGLTSRHSDLGGFIDPDGARSLSQGPVVPVGTP